MARRSTKAPITLSQADGRRLWLRAQRLDTAAPFGEGPAAVPAAVAHLGYVQIDTIAVVERCHHHILWSRIPAYRRAHLQAAQSESRSVFEYWTHALSYVPVDDWRFFRAAMARHKAEPRFWFGPAPAEDLRRLLKRIRDDGPLSIRDIDDDVLVDKDHAWASRKPSKRALQHLFFTGALTIAARSGMVKTYELTERHFGWAAPPRPATERQMLDYLLDRALRSQAVVSLDSVCHLDAPRKAAIRALIEARTGARRLRPVMLEGSTVEHWAEPAALDGTEPAADAGAAHVLSPFDPLIIQRKRLRAFFGYEHRFEAYVPRAKRQFGYFALPVLLDGAIVALVDCKADRTARRLLIQSWHWTDPETAERRQAVEEALGRFERFQFAD